MTTFKSKLIGPVLSLITLVIILIAAEVAVRVIYPHMVPNTAYDWSSRHEEYSLEKPPNTFRILALGDSFTFGQGVKKGHTFPKQLENQLNEGRKKRFEVVNLGFCGLHTLGELYLLTTKGLNPKTWEPDEKYRGIAYQPDMIILEYTLNDTKGGRFLEDIKPFDDRTINVIKVDQGRYALPLPGVVEKFLIRHSRFYLFFIGRYKQVLTKMNLRDSVDNYFPVRYNDDSVGWKEVQEAFEKFVLIARSKKIPIVLVIYPNMTRFDNYPFSAIHKQVHTAASRIGFNYILDLLPVFKRQDDVALRVSPIDGHPNGKAHKVAASAIFDYLIVQGLVPVDKNLRAH